MSNDRQIVAPVHVGRKRDATDFRDMVSILLSDLLRFTISRVFIVKSASFRQFLWFYALDWKHMELKQGKRFPYKLDEASAFWQHVPAFCKQLDKISKDN